SRELSGSVQVDLQSGDSVTAEYTRNFEMVEVPFPISESSLIPAGAYDFENFRAGYTLGPCLGEGLHQRGRSTSTLCFAGEGCSRVA
ncbi:MAG TPA: hypothetical protein VFT13_10265, partial [Candidatus Krumholzibacteria bacterium]|nr:hypothetical protein [Candidatus Krumholzibacteria bacterium]